jgi:hypothetical protein
VEIFLILEPTLFVICIPPFKKAFLISSPLPIPADLPDHLPFARCNTLVSTFMSAEKLNYCTVYSSPFSDKSAINNP